MLFLYMFTIIILNYFELQWLGFLDIQKLLFCLILLFNRVVSFGNMICHNDRSLPLHHLQSRCRIEKVMLPCKEECYFIYVGILNIYIFIYMDSCTLCFLLPEDNG